MTRICGVSHAIWPIFALLVTLFPPQEASTQSRRQFKPALIQKFAEGESVYRKPNALKVIQLRPDIHTKAPKLFESMIGLTARYEGLERQIGPSKSRSAEIRALAREKVQLYVALGITREMLGIEKNEVDSYLSFWSDFWARTDRWISRNPVSDGYAGPFSLSRSSPTLMSRIVEGPATALAQLLSPAPAYASTACPFCTYDFPQPYTLRDCNDEDGGKRTPLYGDGDEQLFYFTVIQCWSGQKDNTLYDFQQYEFNGGGCERENEKSPWKPTPVVIYLRYRENTQSCPKTPAMGDVAGLPTKLVSVEYNAKHDVVNSYTMHFTYCAPTQGAERLHKAYDNKTIENRGVDGRFVPGDMPCD